MRKLPLFIVFAAASLSAAAQQQQDPRSPNADQQQPRSEQQSPASIERARTEGAAGGTATLPDEKRKGVGAGAGPHLRDNLPSPQKLPRDKPVEPSR